MNLLDEVDKNGDMPPFFAFEFFCFFYFLYRQKSRSFAINQIDILPIM